MARFSPGTMAAAIFAILIGLTGAFAVRQYLHNSPVVAAVEKPEVVRPLMIPTASNDLPAGRTLTLSDIVITSVKPADLKKTKFYQKPFMPNVQQILGRTLVAEHKKGEAFLPENLYPEGMGPSVIESLRPGFRAVSIPIKNIQAVAGFARPGSVVDVIYRSKPHNGNPEMAMTLLERVELLAVGEISYEGHKVSKVLGEKGSSVTVAVTPIQAKALKIVEDKGDLTLALRRNEDNMVLPVSNGSDAMTLEQLLGLPINRRATQVDIYHGSRLKRVHFDEAAMPVEEKARFGDMINTPIAAEFPQNFNNATGFNGATGSSELTSGGGGG
ncbi:MAG: Flp pilus assembly protein CpaB [Planctomycetota bacterium]